MRHPVRIPERRYASIPGYLLESLKGYTFRALDFPSFPATLLESLKGY